MKRLLLLSLLSGMLLAAQSSRAELLVDPAGGTPLLQNAADDDVASGRPLGFAFSFFGGEPISAVDVATNGNLNFSRDTEFTNRPMPSPETPRISPLWDDLEVMELLGDSIVEKVEPGVYYSVTWTAHSRLNPLSRHVFQVVLFGQAKRIGNLSFQANDIVFAYRQLGIGFDKGSATVGLDAGDEFGYATVPELDASGGEAQVKYAPDLLKLGGGLLLFRFDEENFVYALPTLSNRQPIAEDDAGYGSGTITIPVLENDWDFDLHPALLGGAGGGAFGAVTADLEAGTVTYTPGANFKGTDEFSYTLLDGLGGTATGTVRIMPFAVAKGAYDGPLLEPVEYSEEEPSEDYPVEEQGHLKIVVKEGGNFAAEIRYIDETSLKFEGQFNGAGHFTKLVTSVPASEDEYPISADVALVLEFSDGVNRITGTIGTDYGPLELVAPRSINSPPESKDDLVYLRTSGPLVMNVLDNDIDRDGDLLTIKSFTQGTAGSVSLSADARTLTYYPDKAGGGTDRLSYTVTDPDGLTATAQVTVLSYNTARGNFDGLVRLADPYEGTLVAENSGRLRVTVLENGQFTAALWYGGDRFTVRGAFDRNGDFQGTLQLPEELVLTVKLHLDLTQNANQITGTISDADGAYISQVAVGRSRFRPKFYPAPQAGTYGLLPLPDEYGEPSAFGFARVFVTTNGQVRVTGKLGDGTPFTMPAQLQMDGTIPFFLHRKVRGTKRTGFVLGTLTFANPLAKSDVSGHLTWFMPPNDDWTYEGFTAEMDVTGAPYVPPAAGESLLALAASGPNAEVMINSEPMPVTIGSDNRVSPPAENPNHLVVRLQTSTGLFSGSFTEPVTLDSGAEAQVRRNFTGLILRQQNRGLGIYMGSEGAGTVAIGPPPIEE